jgi:hypothetical protein
MANLGPQYATGIYHVATPFSQTNGIFKKRHALIGVSRRIVIVARRVTR